MIGFPLLLRQPAFLQHGNRCFIECFSVSSCTDKAGLPVFSICCLLMTSDFEIVFFCYDDTYFTIVLAVLKPWSVATNSLLDAFLQLRHRVTQYNSSCCLDSSNKLTNIHDKEMSDKQTMLTCFPAHLLLLDSLRLPWCIALCAGGMHVLGCLERFSQPSWTPAHLSPDRHMSLLHLHYHPKWGASAVGKTKALSRGDVELSFQSAQSSPLIRWSPLRLCLSSWKVTVQECMGRFQSSLAGSE